MRHAVRTLVVVVLGALAVCSSAAGQTAPPAKSAAKAAAAPGERQPPSAAEKPQPASPPGASGAKTPAAADNAAAGAPPNTDQLIDPPGFAYVPAGRRDPFVSLLRRGSDARAAGSGLRPPGLAGLGVEEITLRGTVRSQDGFVGILQGADQKTYIVRPGDRLLDGTIRTISQNDLVILQQVNDPLSLEKQREVRKMLRQIEAN